MRMKNLRIRHHNASAALDYREFQATFSGFHCVSFQTIEFLWRNGPQWSETGYAIVPYVCAIEVVNRGKVQVFTPHTLLCQSL